MRVYQGLDQFQPPADGVVLSIGNFDGVHLGHRRLIDSARAEARRLGVPTVAMTLEPHPLAVVAPQRAVAPLTTLKEKVALLETLGVDATIVLRSTRALLNQSAEQFLEELAKGCRPRAIVEGPTFNFGRGRAGTVQTLREQSRRLGFTVTVVEELHADAISGKPAINSSTIRATLRQGRLADANSMLGRPYRISGVVDGGQQRGVRLGFPTANLAGIPHLLPREAVYVAVAQLADDSLHLAAVNIGAQPTFQQTELQVEAFLLDYAGQLRGQCVGLHLLEMIREQIRFASVDELIAQLHADVEQARRSTPALACLREAALVPL